MSSRLEEVKIARTKKLKNLLEEGINPFPSKLKFPKLNISDARKSKDGLVAVAGRITALRPHGNSTFADLKDESGKVQLFFQKKALKVHYKTLKNLDLGDFLLVSGELFTTQAGELTINVSKFQLLTKSLRPLPSAWYGLKDTEERYRQRYVDILINPEVKKVFETRSKIVSRLRSFMEENSFIEVETPVLQPIYGGASAQPFITHHNALESNYYIRISVELYLKRLIVAGFEKVYEIGKVFRNEGIDKAHNPEFTMMEFYWAYANYEDLMSFSEEMLSTLLKDINGSLQVEHQGDLLDFTPPWPRKTYKELLLEGVGIDIDKENSEQKLKKALKEKALKLDLKEIVGFGQLCDKLYKEFIRPNIVSPTLVTDYPAEMIALAKKKEDDQSKIASFQLVVKGYELIKAYNELNDPIDQEKRWLEEEKLGVEGMQDHMVVDKDYINALEYAMPPTAGWGMGIDRLTSILTNQPSIKDTIIFPTLKPLGKPSKTKKPSKA